MKYYEIGSTSNEQFKIFKSLLTSKGIKEHGLFILSGEKLIHEFLKNPSPRFKTEFLLFNDEVKVQTAAKLTKISNDLFKELDVLGTHFNLLVLSTSSLPEKDLNVIPKDLELICPLGDPRNLGSLIRTAVGFGIHTLILTSESAHPFLPQSLKSSAGAALKISIFQTRQKVSEIELIGENFALELHGTQLEKVVWPPNLRLWVGEEGPGLKLSLEQKRKMKFVHIPTENIESLNATVSTSLALWEWRKSYLIKDT